MIDVIMERVFLHALGEGEHLDIRRSTSDCRQWRRVVWHESLVSEDGSRVVCHFSAPDEESVRILAAREPAARTSFWSGSVTDTGRTDLPTVVVERGFEEPVSLASIQAIEDAGAWCLEQHGVTFLRTFFSASRKRMICLYTAADAESVRLAQQQAGVPMACAWACHRIIPDTSVSES